MPVVDAHSYGLKRHFGSMPSPIQAIRSLQFFLVQAKEPCQINCVDFSHKTPPQSTVLRIILVSAFYHKKVHQRKVKSQEDDWMPPQKL